MSGYSQNPDRSTVPPKIRYRIINIEPGQSFDLTFTSEQLAKNMYQAIRAFLLGYDRKVGKQDAIAATITISRSVTVLTVAKRNNGLIEMGETNETG